MADRLAIPFYALNLEQEFGRIIDYFVDEYTAGRTPNPCVQCNNWIKFGKLFDYADSVGAEFVATGHYARLDPSGRWPSRIVRGRDARRINPTCCSAFEREFLSRMLLPVGDYEKPAIRSIGGQIGTERCREKRQPGDLFRHSGPVRRVCSGATSKTRPRCRHHGRTRDL